MDIAIRKWVDLAEDERRRILKRSEDDIDSVYAATKQIMDDVRAQGDKALIRYTSHFDSADISNMPLLVTETEYEAARMALSPEIVESISLAVENVMRFHRAQKPEGIHFIETTDGIFAGERATPIPSVGLYVPRGKGSFPSMLYMMAVPARIAGVPRICVCTPPNKDGSVDPACLYAARLCGVHEVYRVGGAQAVAALAYGTETIAGVDKLCGPGSPYVSAAQRLARDSVTVGLPAGPSEAVILADETADPWRLALDLLIEAEHGPDSSALLVTHSREVAEKAAVTITRLVTELPEPRRGFVEAVLSGYGGIILSSNLGESIAIVNQYAPEHLQIRTRDPWEMLSQIEHAGEILLGENTPFSLANYAAGPNAVLPTGGKARTWSSVSVRDFVKYSSVIYATKKGLDTLGGAAARLADYEGFPSHERAITMRDGE